MARQLSEAWNKDTEDGLRARVTEAIEARVTRRRRDVQAQLEARHETDRRRVIGVFDRFGRTLNEALEEAEAAADDSQLGLFDDERRQSTARPSSDQGPTRLAVDERDRELDAVDARYADVQALHFSAAVLFAISL